MKATLYFVFALAGIALTSCNTTIGLGRDMRILGTEMEKKADASYNGSGDGSNYDTGGAPVY